MHFNLSLVITQDVAGILRQQARLGGFLDIRHYCRDLLYKAASVTAPVEAPSHPVRLAPTQLKVMRALKASTKPMSVFDFVRATATSRQSIHVNVKELHDDGLIEVVSQHSDGSPGAPRRYFKATDVGLARLERHEGMLRAQHEQLQAVSERSALATGAVGESTDPEEMEALRAVRASFEAKRARQADYDALPDEELSSTQMRLLLVVFANTRNMDTVRAKAQAVTDLIKRRFMEGEALAQIRDEATLELEPLGGWTKVLDEMKASIEASKAKPVDP